MSTDTLITSVRETPGQTADTIVFTAGSHALINASAEKVFDIITNYKGYSSWNSWTPRLEFSDGAAIHLGSEGTLFTEMGSGKAPLEIPIKIIVHSRESSASMLAWRASYLPSWFAVAERVQEVTPRQDDPSTCEVKQWESMSGWGAYILKYVMGVPKQLEAANLKYIQELKAFAEGDGEASRT